MTRFNQLFKWSWTFLLAVTLTLGLAGCDGDDGAAGSTGAAGTPGSDGQACWDLNGNGVGDVGTEDIDDNGVVDVLDCQPGADPVAAAVEKAKVESCGTCHDGIGEGHQALYDKYVDTSAFEMTFTNFTTAPGAVAGTFDGTLELTILKNGVPFTDYDLLNEKTFIVVDYDSVNNQYLSGRQYLDDSVVMVAPGDYVLTGTGLSFDPTVNGQVYGYIAQTPLFTKVGEIGAEIPTGSHVELFDDVANAALAFGDASAADPDAYASVANVGGCVKCHGQPYLKHGFRAAEVAGVLPDFAACKSCHYSGRNGFLSSLQYMVDDPFSWATGVAAPAGLYTYEGSIMNDTHMAHAMEFPYPQSMANCSTCHGTLLDDAGLAIPGTDKLALILDDSNFTAETCKSCHAVQGIDAYPKTFNPDGSEIVDRRGNSVPEKYGQPKRAPALAYLWTPEGGYNSGDLSFHDGVIDSAAPDACTTCHGVAGIARGLAAIHTGYDPTIYDATGTKYADLYKVSIDLLTWDDVNSTLKIDFSANDPAIGIMPEVLVSLYGWDSKNFIVPSHARDANSDRLEYEPADLDTNPLFSGFAETAPGVWTVTANLAAFQPVGTDPDDILALDIPTLIARGKVKKAEVTITPTLTIAGISAVLQAVDATFDLNAGVVVSDYFKAEKSVVDIEKCNACHDALASSFHDGSGRAGDGIEVCKNCHNPTFDGGHIEMASRSIDSYVHAIHTFQDFDVDDTFDTSTEPFDPVKAKRYDLHINHVFPNFTIRNCEACHKDGTVAVTYNVPDQSESIPGIQSESWIPDTWYRLDGSAAVEDTAGRKIGIINETVTGPASRACGGCHRGRLINDDAPGELASFNAHVEAFGTYVENEDDDDTITYGIIDKIMSMFE